MSTPLNPTIQFIVENPEVKSFIYQMIADLEPFITPQTVVTVAAKNPRKLALQYEAEGKEFSIEELKNLHRISITLSEGDSKISAEGLDRDLFIAIREAKENLVKELIAIQDAVISHQDRLIQINHYLQNTHLH